jgi:hypothetical protein
MMTSRTIVPLEDNNLRRFAPSIFAERPYVKMSDRYRFVPTIEVVNILRTNQFFPIRASESRTGIEDKKGFTRHMIRFRHTDYLASPKLNEEIPELVLMNSHDGGCAYKFNAGLFRLVCLNGLVVSSADFGSMSVRHTGDHDFTKQVIDATFQVVENTPKVIEQINTWKAIELKPDQRLALASASKELHDRGEDINAADLLRPKRYDDRKSDLWTTFNVVQENLTKGGVPLPRTATGRRSSTKSIRDIGKDVRLNKALWTLASKLAESVG